VLAMLVALAGTTYGWNGYNAAHGPFDDHFNAPRLVLHEIHQETISIGTNSNTGEILFSTNKPVRTEIRVRYGAKVDSVEISEEGHEVLAKTPFSDFGTAGGMMAYTADLNMDGKRDFVIFSSSGGCGLACGGCNVALILSDSNNTYRLTTVQTLFPDECEFLVLNGKPCFIQTSFDSVEKCNDGNGHNFWIYNLLVFEGGDIKVKNELYRGFPKIIWYSFKPNHKETDLISQAQKNELIKASLSEIFWDPRRTNK